MSNKFKKAKLKISALLGAVPYMVMFAGIIGSVVNADYAGIDFIKDKYGKFKVIEINSIPAWKALQKTTSKNIASILAKAFFKKI